jgi:transposase
VAVKSEAQQAAGLVFRTRDLLVRQRTQLINAIRGHLDAVLMAKRLRRANPISGNRMSLQRIAEHLAEAGHVNERGKPYNPKSVLAMVNGPRPKGHAQDDA